MVALLAVAASPAAANVDPLYAFTYGAETNLLVAYDPVRIVPSGAPIRMGRFAHAWSISPDRSRLVVAAGVRRPGEPTALRFVDLEHRRMAATVTLQGEARRVSATAWARDRVLVLVAGSRAATVYAIDPSGRAAVSSVELAGQVVRGERRRNGLVLLLAPADGIGPATLALVDHSAHVRTVRLERVSAGTALAAVGADRRATIHRPALALAPSGKRAFVFGAGVSPAAVDLATLSVRYAPLRVPARVEKRATGWVRSAAALPDGRIVVSGFDYGKRGAIGLRLVDPADWSVRVLDRAATWFRVSGGHLFTRGRGGVGLRVVKPSGRAVDLFPTGSVGSVDVIGRRALVTFFGTGRRAAVVDLGTGGVVRHTVPAHPLLGAGQQIDG